MLGGVICYRSFVLHRVALTESQTKIPDAMKSQSLHLLLALVFALVSFPGLTGASENPNTDECASLTIGSGETRGNVVVETFYLEEHDIHEVFVTVDVTDGNTLPDGVAEEVFVLQMEAVESDRQSMFVEDVRIVYDEDRVEVIGQGGHHLVALRLDGAQTARQAKANSVFSGYGLIRSAGAWELPDGYGSQSAGSRLPLSLVEARIKAVALSECDSGGSGATSCSISCPDRSCSVSCSEGTTACCNCGIFTGPSCTCKSDGGFEEG